MTSDKEAKCAISGKSRILNRSPISLDFQAMRYLVLVSFLFSVPVAFASLCRDPRIKLLNFKICSSEVRVKESVKGKPGKTKKSAKSRSKGSKRPRKGKSRRERTDRKTIRQLAKKVENVESSLTQKVERMENNMKAMRRNGRDQFCSERYHNLSNFDYSAKANIAFDADMYRKALDRKPSENLIISPFSVSTMLTMLMNAAEGKTQRQIVEALHLEENTTRPALCRKSFCNQSCEM